MHITILGIDWPDLLFVAVLNIAALFTKPASTRDRLTCLSTGWLLAMIAPIAVGTSASNTLVYALGGPAVLAILHLATLQPPAPAAARAVARIAHTAYYTCGSTFLAGLVLLFIATAWQPALPYALIGLLVAMHGAVTAKIIRDTFEPKAAAPAET